jgi:hypothetical protein
MTTTIEVGIEFFLPTDARHWIPNGFATVDLEVDAALLEDDADVAIDEAAEAWCDRMHGKGSFSQVLLEP